MSQGANLCVVPDKGAEANQATSASLCDGLQQMSLYLFQ
jgi:hypothetical protein